MTGRPRRLAWGLLLLLIAAPVAWAHPTIVFGELSTDPSPPRADAPVEVRFTLHDPVEAPVEQAIVFLEATYRPPGTVAPGPPPGEAADPEALAPDGSVRSDGNDPDATEAEDAPALPPGGFFASDEFEEVTPADYRTTVVFPYDGEWTVTLRDRTYRQEETNATMTLTVGPAGTEEPITFLFPPTAIGPQSLAAWLIWLVGVPLLAGAVVTVLVLRSAHPDVEEDAADEDEENEDTGEDEERGGG